MITPRHAGVSAVLMPIAGRALGALRLGADERERVDDTGRGPAERYRAALPGRHHELAIEGYDRAGVPTLSAEWASDGSGASGPSAQTGVGYGDTAGGAATGAWGELTEELLLARHVARVRPVTGSYAGLARAHGADRVVDPVSLVLPAGCDASPDRPLLWLPAVRWRTGEQVLVPAEFVAASPGALPYGPPSGQWLTTPITNGLGAGDTLERAVLHGLLELVQRDGNTVSHRALDTGVVVDLAAAADPALHAVVDDLAARGIDVDVKLASTELATVVHAVGTDRAAVAGEAPVVPVALSALGEAAHPDPVQAARKAVLEYAASRARRAFAFGPLEEVRRRDPDYLERELARPLAAQEQRALADHDGLDAPVGRRDDRRPRADDRPHHDGAVHLTSGGAVGAGRRLGRPGRAARRGARPAWPPSTSSSSRSRLTDRSARCTPQRSSRPGSRSRRCPTCASASASCDGCSIATARSSGSGRLRPAGSRSG